MKTTLTFDLPKEQANALEAIHASDAWRFISDFQQLLRSLWKHGDSRAVSVDELWTTWHDMKPSIEGVTE